MKPVVHVRRLPADGRLDRGRILARFPERALDLGVFEQHAAGAKIVSQVAAYSCRPSTGHAQRLPSSVT
ncbi:hypothetical protein OG946_24470 [Streptomyces sp. NBC_01808]|uniref:hypothetical protein n=1 Tax=Streptomyces sp. NBC_01808 TaxID=2975947 RepID=UPI002DD8394C|nr:hypothetical protein [Streptomyces sp. NBC_01808]WSA40241.1 hypothetical protein OG946_24470 [Streptomyces sp. NBC_01808]